MTHKIGEVIFADGVIEVNAGKPVTKLVVTNTGDRTIQVRTVRPEYRKGHLM